MALPSHLNIILYAPLPFGHPSIPPARTGIEPATPSFNEMLYRKDCCKRLWQAFILWCSTYLSYHSRGFGIRIIHYRLESRGSTYILNKQVTVVPRNICCKQLLQTA